MSFTPPRESTKTRVQQRIHIVFIFYIRILHSYHGLGDWSYPPAAVRATTHTKRKQLRNGTQRGVRAGDARGRLARPRQPRRTAAAERIRQCVPLRDSAGAVCCGDRPVTANHGAL